MGAICRAYRCPGYHGAGVLCMKITELIRLQDVKRRRSLIDFNNQFKENDYMFEVVTYNATWKVIDIVVSKYKSPRPFLKNEANP